MRVNVTLRHCSHGAKRGRLAEIAEQVIVINDTHYGRVEDAHMGICHLLCCCSKHAASFLLRLDYTGIVALIVASFFPPVYYGFMCNPYWRTFYLTTTSAMGAPIRM